MKIHFIRHTTPDITAGVCYGQADIDLADGFAEEAQVLIKKLQRQTNHGQYDQIFSSPAQRCFQLATKIQLIQLDEQKLQNNVVVDKNLHEVNFGDWELKNWENIPRIESQPWTDDFINMAPPNGESLLAMQKRVNAFMDGLAPLTSTQTEPDNSSIAIVTHAGVMRLITARYLEIPLTKIFNLKLNYGQIIELNFFNNCHSLRFVD